MIKMIEKVIFIMTAFALAMPIVHSQNHPVFATDQYNILYALNLPNCTVRKIDSTKIDFFDIAFTSDGRLWGITFEQSKGSLYEIDTATAEATFIGNTTVASSALIALNDTTLLAESDYKLYGIHTQTAATHLIDSIGYASLGDFAWHGDSLYMTEFYGGIVRILFNRTYDKIESAILINDSTTPIPGFYGLATLYASDSSLTLVGFPKSGSAAAAYTINTKDGSSQEICANLFPNGPARGAASIDPYPKIKPLTVNNVPPLELILSIYPNPTRDKIRVCVSEATRTIPPYYKIEVSDYTGRRISTQSCTIGDGLEVDLSGLAKGLYLIRIANKVGHLGTYKVMKY